MTTARIRLVVVDDHPVVREGLVALIERARDLEVIGEAGDGPTAVAQVAALDPDVVLLDLELPGLDGVEVLRRLRAADPERRVIVFTAFDTDERILAALEAGARGYLLKGAPRQQLFAAIRIVHGGGSLLEPQVAAKLMRLARESRRPRPGPQRLTPREQEVLQLLARGLPNKELAQVLSIKERTVRAHVGAILAKLGADNRTEAVAIALQERLITI